MSHPGARPVIACTKSDDIERLQQVLFYRQLGFSLEQIGAALASPRSALDHLADQRRLLVERISHLERLVAAIDRAIEDGHHGVARTPWERFAAFTGVSEEYQRQAEARYGPTEMWKKGQRTFTGDEMDEAMEARRAWVARLQRAIERAVSPVSEEAMDTAEAHRQSAIHYFGYDDDYGWHVAFCDEYVQNPESLGYVVMPIEQRPGMAEFLRVAARANARRGQDSAG